MRTLNYTCIVALIVFCIMPCSAILLDAVGLLP
jgi:hypothetical protein